MVVSESSAFRQWNRRLRRSWSKRRVARHRKLISALTACSLGCKPLANLLNGNRDGWMGAAAPTMQLQRRS